MERLGLAGIIVTAAWLVVVAVLMAWRPDLALRMLRATAKTRTINVAEQGLRLLAGAALVLRASASRIPELLALAGWFVVLSSIVLLILPLRWHAGYAIWWADRLTPTAVRTLAPLSLIAAGTLLYAAI